MVAALATPAAAAPLQVDGPGDLAVWPAVTVWTDADAALTAEQVLAARSQFTVPAGTRSNLGRSSSNAWLRFELQVPGEHTQQRVLEIDYPLLGRIDLHLVRDGRVVQHLVMGSEVPKADRPLPSRTHAAKLQLAPGHWEVLLQVRSQTSLVLPITLRTPESFTEHESFAQLVQGVMLGLALCMLIYSLSQALGLRDETFVDYAVLLGANIVFILAYFGVGALYLWTDAPPLAQTVAPMAVMLAVAGGTRFTVAAMAVHEVSPTIAWLLRAVSVVALLALAATLTGLASYRTAQALVTVIGIATTALVVPAAYLRVRRGDRGAVYMLVGWAAYTIGALVTAGLLRGLVEPTFWSQHLYPLSLIVEMTAWLAVLSQRVQAIHRNADRVRLETETLRTLSQTDPLTGLPNRRGLQQRLEAALPRAGPQRLLALYLLDLDGFKPVNDRYGHDVGDALLIAVGQRLQAQLRGADVVARLGGDEFVVLVSDLADETAAQAVGRKLLGAVDSPIDCGGQHCQVGLTIGYALSPVDGLGADELLKRADAAMYAGKQSGRGRLQRGGRSLSLA